MEGRYQLFPPLSSEEYAALEADIRENGVLIPIEVDEEGNILDGHHRAEISERLGLFCPRVQRCGFSEEEKRAYVRALNLLRRHLSQAQKRAIIAQQWTETPDATASRIAHLFGVHSETAATVREEMVRAGAISESEIAVTASGVLRVRRNTPRTKLLDDPNKVARKNQQPTRQQPRALPDGKFNLILADPPWQSDFRRGTGRDVENHYSCMPLGDICDLAERVQQVAARDCLLFLWATSPMLPEALSVMRAWSFKYKASAIWHKSGKGMGYYFRVDHELLLLGTRGSPGSPEPPNRPSSVFTAPKRAHSAKPVVVHEALERMYPDACKLEMFARGKARPGWSAWGAEAIEEE